MHIFGLSQKLNIQEINIVLELSKGTFCFDQNLIAFKNQLHQFEKTYIANLNMRYTIREKTFF
ncbi:hypothetical protein SAMN04489724_2919 [Algoriphagus locisalis]|uniref:Uncharacterized protein n=1 Tax=Algoriphagus locisalis TaxID=305507 RepID=A0A1I7C704_9BACT|nr:hypothetical protein SAMN04489724_2919 [Algoriphagus locisalis]